MTSNSKHSRFSPSKMARRIACPGSAHIDNKNTTNPYADEGTEAHKIAADLLDDRNLRGEVILAEAAHPIAGPDDHIIKNIQPYIDYVESINGNQFVETQVAIKSISEEIYGTADCIVDDWPHRLHIIDLKYGAGKIVEVEDNAQLATYALGALETFGDDFEEIWITIVQPRIEHKDGPIRTWKTTPAELKKNWYNKIKKAYEKAIAKPDLFKPGYHCMWCTGAMECPGAKKESKAIVKKFEKSEAITDDNKKLAKLLNSEQMILEYLKQAKQEAFERLRTGQKIPGFKLVRNFGNTTWIDKAKAERVFSLHSDACWDRSLKSIGKLKKIVSPDIVDRLTHRPDKGLALVPESDKRQSYRGAVDDFAEE